MSETAECMKLDEIDRRVARYVAAHMPGELEVYLKYTNGTYRAEGKAQFDVVRVMEELCAEDNV